jgi:cell division protein FtsB
MREPEDKNKLSFRKKIVLLGVVCFLLVLLITSLFGKKGLIEIHRARKNYEALLLQVERLKQEKNRLEREIQELQKNPKAIDKEAREKLWLVKPEEKIVVKTGKKPDK